MLAIQVSETSIESATLTLNLNSPLNTAKRTTGQIRIDGGEITDSTVATRFADFSEGRVFLIEPIRISEPHDFTGNLNLGSTKGEGPWEYYVTPSDDFRVDKPPSSEWRPDPTLLLQGS